MSATELTSRVRISDPRPSHCAACFRGAEDGVRFVDMDAAIDRGSIVTDQGAVVGTLDDLHLCEACVKAAAEALALRPTASANQMRRIAQLEKELTALRGYARSLERTLSERPDSLKGKER